MPLWLKQQLAERQAEATLRKLLARPHRTTWAANKPGPEHLPGPKHKTTLSGIRAFVISVLLVLKMLKKYTLLQMLTKLLFLPMNLMLLISSNNILWMNI